MSFFDQIFEQLFPSGKPNLPIEEKINRSELDKNAYFRWLNEGRYRFFLDKIKKAYWLKKENLTSDIEIHLLKINGSNGFAITYSDWFGQKDFQFLFDFFKEKMQNLSYQHYTSNRLIYDKEKYVETVEKHYLKPPINLPENNKPSDQKYGNVLIEHISINKKPSYIKLMANYYEDQHHQKPLPFDDLVKELFE
ncbi:MAG: hypothetical protein EAZ97_07470 [Bacteroidetes bacterium]|nr:MAG: hypothetical protein EAZ97_07470 [Bacteroidota bacterium]